MQCVKMMKDLIEKSDEECDWALDLGSKNIVVPVLLTLLSHSLDDLRAATMDCLESLVKTPKSQDSKESSYYHLVLQVIERRDEIQLDKKLVSPVGLRNQTDGCNETVAHKRCSQLKRLQRENFLKILLNSYQNF